ncbi:hypothetical protein BG842_15505 [Haladaptatus sp. W1]|uniref:hypothetical protein n=1 Tax=Haladaptatus sp. W1 TaxID=1897478 RepID=UPI000849AF1A|nr:hypothetical protein [Haladaptatus sp. W1]ODR81910.1 hypothetical protein BG842_15505 [Haladaptatus sp. W1]
MTTTAERRRNRTALPPHRATRLPNRFLRSLTLPFVIPRALHWGDAADGWPRRPASARHPEIWDAETNF